MTDETGNTILYEVERGRVRITLNRPEKRNALSEDMLARLERALWQADDDTAVHSVILSGAGPDFCSGYDIGKPGTGTDDPTRRGLTSFDDDAWRLERFQRYRMALFDMHKPVIAQVHGRCLAGGTDLALLCDMVICADDAAFGFPAVRSMGSPPNHMWLYHTGPQWAKRLILTGDSVLGRDAARIGLAMQSVPAEDLGSTVEALADRMSHIDPDLLSINKRIVNLGMELMGARTLQRMAAEMDARGHLSRGRSEFAQLTREKGLKAAVQERDAPFGDGIVKL